MIEFDWDDKKAKLNKAKHRVSLESGEPAVNDYYAVTEFNDTVNDEDRWQTIGMSKNGVLLFVIHTIEENETKPSRIISVRKADEKERRKYEKRRNIINSR